MAKKLVAIGYVVLTCKKCEYDFPIEATGMDTADLRCPNCQTLPEEGLVREGVRTLIRLREIQTELGDAADFDDVRIRERETA